MRSLLIYIGLMATPYSLSECAPKYIGTGSFESEDEFEIYVNEFLSLPEFAPINSDAFKYAITGFDKMNNNANDSTLVLIDFSLSANQQRFYVIDMNNKKVLFQRLCSHGKNSGEEYATKFSNKEGSLMSSIGFYITAETYQGNNGLSLRLDGMEKGYNSNARNRDVVIHAADYCSEEFIDDNGRLGRSFGCPSLPHENYEQVIERIKNGTCLFIYYPDAHYLKDSNYLK